MDRRVLKAAKAIAALAQMDRSGEEPKDWDDIDNEEREDMMMVAGHCIDLWDALNGDSIDESAYRPSGSRKKKGRSR